MRETDLPTALLLWIDAPLLRWALTSAYLGLVALIAVYGVHRFWLVWLRRRHRGEAPTPPHRFDALALPRVTVQLPLFNEGSVAARIIDAAAALDYPRDRLQIQVLDDSNDGSEEIARRRIEHWIALGLDITHHRRPDRRGYKAGALADGTPSATGELIAIFDADFIPPTDFIRNTVDHFTDPSVGMVQARWSHLNREDSWLTRCQGIFLDGHFVVEHAARSRSGRWIHFNGTAGVWRRATIDDAGGWSDATLSEDLDLSIRAQRRGWRFVFRSDLECPAELPPTVSAYKSQQHRWAKGTMQAAKAHLLPVLRSDAPPRVKTEVFFQLTWPIASVLITLSAVLYFPAFYVHVQPWARGSAWGTVFGFVLLTTGIVSAAAFYAASQVGIRRSGVRAVLYIPALIIVGIGIALTNTRGVIEAILGHRSGFVRTPKFGDASGAEPDRDSDSDSESARSDKPGRGAWTKLVQPAIEASLGSYMLLCVALAMSSTRGIISVPLLILFAIGYLWFGSVGLRDQFRRRRHAASIKASSPTADQLDAA